MSDERFTFTHRRGRRSRPSPARPSWRRPTRRASTSRGSAIVEGLRHQGGCRVCTVKAGGRSVAACTQPAEPGLDGRERHAAARNRVRRDLVEMLFHEGNHLCPICEKSGNCELQAMAYRLDMTEPTRFPYLEPMPRSGRLATPTSRSTPTAASPAGAASAPRRIVDGKGVFGYVGRGIHRRVAVNGADLAHTDAALTDHAMSPRSARSAASSARARASACRSASAHFDHGLIGARDRGEAANERAPQGARRHRLARRLLRLPHGDPRHRRAPDRADGAGRVRPLAADRHQALHPALRHRHHRGRLLQRGKRPCPAWISAATATC